MDSGLCLGFLAFLVLLAIVAYSNIKEFAKPDRSVPSHGEGTLEILKKRYARGEIISEDKRSNRSLRKRKISES